MSDPSTPQAGDLPASADGALRGGPAEPDDGVTAAVDRAYEEIRARIGDGRLPSGSRLREKQLADEVGVSRTPVREALQRLALEGMIDMLPRRGAVVTTWTAKDLDEIFELRAMLEGHAAELAAKRITDEDLMELDQLAHEMQRRGRGGSEDDLDELMQLYRRFHQLVLRSADNKRLELVLSQIIDAPLLSRTFHRYTAAELGRSTTHHLEIVAALRAGAAGWAKSAMRTTILAARAVHAGPASLDGDVDRAHDEGRDGAG